METMTKLLPVTDDLYWVKPGQTGQTPLKEKSSNGQIPWCSQTGQAATGQEESITQKKATGTQLYVWRTLGQCRPYRASFLC